MFGRVLFHVSEGGRGTLRTISSSAWVPHELSKLKLLKGNVPSRVERGRDLFSCATTDPFPL